MVKIPLKNRTIFQGGMFFLLFAMFVNIWPQILEETVDIEIQMLIVQIFILCSVLMFLLYQNRTWKQTWVKIGKNKRKKR